MFTFFKGNKKITEKLYERNLELAVKNKTLSLLEELYQKSVENLAPEQMAKQITNIICKDLNLELAGVLAFKKESDTLKPLAFSKSERLVRASNEAGFLFSDIDITNISKNDFFKKVIYEKKDNMTNDMQDVWQQLIKKESLEKIKIQSHIKTLLLYPLIKGNEVMSVLLLGLNRDYNTLNTFEKKSIGSFVNVIALLLDKSYLYKNLQDSYVATKKAYGAEKQAREEIAKMADDVRRAYVIEKKAKEDLERLDKIKNQFLAQTQHDLRTPLSSIMGYSDLLLHGSFGKKNKDAQEIIGKLQTVAQNMIRKINNFLDVTQFQLGKNPVALKPGVELKPILEEIAEELVFKAKSKNIFLKLQKVKDHILVSADREKLKAAIFNVIDNSVKYTPQGGVTIKTAKNGAAFQIIISDTGIGMSRESQKTLFDRIFERDEVAKKVATGSGIGLYLATQIIKAHNGKIWVQSEGENKGSTFYIELPTE